MVRRDIINRGFTPVQRKEDDCEVPGVIVAATVILSDAVGVQDPACDHLHVNEHLDSTCEVVAYIVGVVAA